MEHSLNTLATGLFALVMSLQGCASEPPASATPPSAATSARPAEPAPYPSPPPLTGASTRCATRRFDRDNNAWVVKIHEYDATQRVVGGTMHYDLDGRITRWEMSDTFRIYTYDDHGNLHEEANWKNDVLVEGTRWDNRYEGRPQRIVSTDLSDFRRPKERSGPHTRVRYEYGASGRVEAMVRDWARGTERHVYLWKDDRVVSVNSSLGPRLESDPMPYDERRTYEYDASGRLVKFTVDGELPLGEGATADGKPDHVLTLRYDAAGRLEGMEGDGRGGDISPEAPDGRPDEITLLSPACDPIVRLSPDFFRLPQLGLPRSIEPQLW